MRTRFQIIALAVSLAFSFQSRAQTGDAIFPKGELSTTKNHTGNIWLKELNVGDSTFDPSIAGATYDAGAKLDWHVHPGGQVLLITEGTGYYQERGKPVQVVHKGDVINACPAWSIGTVLPRRVALPIWRLLRRKRERQFGWNRLAIKTTTA